MAESAEILRRFPGPVTLYPSRTKWLLMLVGGLVFSFGGYLMVRDGTDGGWFVLIFFGFGVLVSIVVMLPGANVLTLDRDGFESRSMYRGGHTSWREVSGFTTAKLPPRSFVMVVYDDARYKGGMLASANVALTGRNAALPDTFGLDPDELASLMESWRGRALQAR